jgi:branched-subunit amino acid aminotransferase/4-amino-4-deoxychorismate lyase
VTAAPFSAVFFEGRFVPASDPHGARVPITDRGYLLGEGVFATLRGYNGICFRPERHLETLARGAHAFGMTLPMSIERLADIADEAAVFTGAADAYVRVTLARGADETQPVLSILARGFDVPTDTEYTHGIPVAIVSARRIPPECMDPSIKTTSYAPSVLARREAGLRGARDGIQLAIDGSLACGTMANLFVVMRNTLFTPALATGCRAGVTREAIFEVAAREGIVVREERIDPTALSEADEVFFTSTRVECLPIASVDGHTIGCSQYPHTAAFRGALRRLILEETNARRSKAG